MTEIKHDPCQPQPCQCGGELEFMDLNLFSLVEVHACQDCALEYEVTVTIPEPVIDWSSMTPKEVN